VFTADANNCENCSFTPQTLELYENPYSAHNFWEFSSAGCNVNDLGALLSTVGSDLTSAVSFDADVSDLNTIVLKGADGSVVACGAVVDDDSVYELIQFPESRNNRELRVAVVMSRQSNGKNVLAVQVSGVSGNVDVNTFNMDSCDDDYTDDTITLATGNQWHRISLEESNQRSFNIEGLCIETQLHSQSTVGNPRRFNSIQNVVGLASGTETVFSQKSPFHPTMYNLKFDQTAANAEVAFGGYHVHKFPLANSENDCVGAVTSGHFNPFSASKPYPENPSPRDIEVGDLATKHGSLTSFVYSAEGTDYVDYDLPLFGINTIAGRSIVFHAATGGARMMCMNLAYTNAMQTTTLILENLTHSVEVNLRQNSEADPRSPVFVTFRTSLTGDDVPASAGHDAKIVRGNCDEGQLFGVGDDFGAYGELSFSNSSVSTTHSTEMFVNFDGEFGDFRIWEQELAAVVYEAGDSGEVMFCKQISNSVGKVGASILMLVLM